MFPGSQHFEGQKGVLELQDKDYDEWQASQLFIQTCTNQTISWLMCSCSTFGGRTNHGHTHAHKIHHGPNLGEATTFPLLIFYVFDHGAYTQNVILSPDTQVGSPKILEIETSATLETHNFLFRLPIKVRSEIKL
jgi:hypothetical protein